VLVAVGVGDAADHRRPCVSPGSLPSSPRVPYNFLREHSDHERNSKNWHIDQDDVCESWINPRVVNLRYVFSSSRSTYPIIVNLLVQWQCRAEQRRLPLATWRLRRNYAEEAISRSVDH
jgi:hypothetical protein